MSDQSLDQFLVDRTAEAMKRIEGEIFAEVREGICVFFGADALSDLTEDQIDQVIGAEKNANTFSHFSENFALDTLHCFGGSIN